MKWLTSLSVQAISLIFLNPSLSFHLSISLGSHSKITTNVHTGHSRRPSFMMTLSTSSSLSSTRPHRIAIIGGGTSGCFAAIMAANLIQQSNETNDKKQNVEITVYEATDQVLILRNIHHKNRIDLLFDPITAQKSLREMITVGYSRGSKQIMTLLTTKFPPL